MYVLLLSARPVCAHAITSLLAPYTLLVASNYNHRCKETFFKEVMVKKVYLAHLLGSDYNLWQAQGSSHLFGGQHLSSRWFQPILICKKQKCTSLFILHYNVLHFPSCKGNNHWQMKTIEYSEHLACLLALHTSVTKHPEAERKR